MNMLGHLDLCGYPLIEGWLYCDAAQDEPIRLQIYVGATLIGECVTNRFRKDLQEAGFGTGRCGFSFTVPREHGSADFAQTRLRFADAPVFLMPDESTVIAQRNVPEPGAAVTLKSSG